MPRQLLRRGGDQHRVLERLYDMGAGDPSGLFLNFPHGVKDFYPALLTQVVDALSVKNLLSKECLVAGFGEPGEYNLKVKITPLGIDALVKTSVG